MILFRTAAGLTNYLKTKSETGHTIGFVPTMGALHAGHTSLVKSSKQGMDLTVSSIFVNPSQFNDPQDFARYPVTIEKDILALEQAGADVLFLPSVPEVYPGGIAQLPRFDLGYLETILEGYYRPGHFQGVCQVMQRLLEMVMPHTLFLGRKDYQQCMVIAKLVAICGWDIRLHIAPTLREPSGLAMSSRNTRLTEKDKQSASAIFHSLVYLKQHIRPGTVDQLLANAANRLTEAGFEKIDYFTIADAATLAPVTKWDGHTPVVALAAAFIGGVRLIDNMPMT